MAKQKPQWGAGQSRLLAEQTEIVSNKKTYGMEVQKVLKNEKCLLPSGKNIHHEGWSQGQGRREKNI